MNTVTQAWPISGGTVILTIVTDEPLPAKAMANLAPTVAQIEAWRTALALITHPLSVDSKSERVAHSQERA